MGVERIKRYLTMIRLFLCGGGYKRAEYLRRKHYFKSIGSHCFLQPYNFGTEPYLISFGDNVHVASDVCFITHDITVFMLQHITPEKQYKARVGEIIIGDNVFIGARSIILYNVKIGNNVVIGAGSVVTKDIPDGVVAAGVPCKPIGNFEEWEKSMLA